MILKLTNNVKELNIFLIVRLRMILRKDGIVRGREMTGQGCIVEVWGLFWL